MYFIFRKGAGRNNPSCLHMSNTFIYELQKFHEKIGRKKKEIKKGQTKIRKWGEEMWNQKVRNWKKKRKQMRREEMIRGVKDWVDDQKQKELFCVSRKEAQRCQNRNCLSRLRLWFESFLFLCICSYDAICIPIKESPCTDEKCPHALCGNHRIIRNRLLIVAWASWRSAFICRHDKVTPSPLFKEKKKKLRGHHTQKHLHVSIQKHIPLSVCPHSVLCWM